MRKVAERQNPITVWGSGEAVRDGTYIDDLVAALMKCIDAPAGAYNIGSGEALSVNAMLGVLLMAAGHQPEILHDTTKPQMIGKRVLNCAKARRVLGWEPQMSMVDGLAATLAWYERR